MWNSKKSTVLSMVACFAMMAALVALALLGHRLFDLYFVNFRGITDPERLGTLRRALAACVYPGCVLGLIALASLLKILFHIYGGDVFIRQNVALLRGISWCCFAVAVLALFCCFSYGPLAVVSAAALFVGLILRVVKNVMQSAVELQEESDLTI